MMDSSRRWSTLIPPPLHSPPPNSHAINRLRPVHNARSRRSRHRDRVDKYDGGEVTVHSELFSLTVAVRARRVFPLSSAVIRNVLQSDGGGAAAGVVCLRGGAGSSAPAE